MKKIMIPILGAVSAILAISCKELPFETRILSYDGNKVSKVHVASGETVTVTLPCAE